MDQVETFLNNVRRGANGDNIGFDCGGQQKQKLNKVLLGIQRGIIMTVGGDSSSGKTSLAIDMIYGLLRNNDRPVHILYFSFEMTSSMLLSKLLSLYIFDDSHRIMPSSKILSYGERLNIEDQNYIFKCSEWLKKISNSLQIIDSPCSPVRIQEKSNKWLLRYGKLVEHEDGGVDYIENDNKQLNLIVVDNLQIIGGGGSKKEKIQDLINFEIDYRENRNATFLNLQQLNRSSSSVERKINGYNLIQLSDFKDASESTDGADVVLSLYYPYREKISRCEGYDIFKIGSPKVGLKDRFRILQILKNRYGTANKNIAYGFYGEIGKFVELPNSDTVNSEDGKYNNLKWLT